MPILADAHISSLGYLSFKMAQKTARALSLLNLKKKRDCSQSNLL